MAGANNRPSLGKAIFGFPARPRRALGLSGIGTTRPLRDFRPMSLIEGISESEILTASISHVDPNVWSGRAVQEDFVDLADAVLHQCIRSLIGAGRRSGPSWISARVRRY